MMTRSIPAVSVVASSCNPTTVSVAAGTAAGDPDEPADGSALGLTVAMALAEGDGLAEARAAPLPDGDVEAVPDPPRDSITSTPAPRTTTRSTAMAPVRRRRVWSVTAPS